MTLRKRQLILIFAVLAVVVCADQIAKAAIVAKIPYPDTSFAPGGGPVFFRLTHRRNPGLVGGMFRNKPAMAFVAPIVASLVLVYLYRHLDAAAKLQSIAYGMIGGGAIGNLADRLRQGYVTDFLQFHFHFVPFDFPWKHYPAFNIADSCICTGVFLLIVTWHFAASDEARKQGDAADVG